MTTFRTIPIGSIHESKLNPRKHFDAARLQELTESVRSKGILQPLVVRPNAKGFEVVCGARRLRAARAAEVAEVPAVVRELTDQEVIEVAVVENLQREDVHPLEEAEGYEQLLKLAGHTVEDLAAKVGKSKAYVYARMKLCALGPEARKAFYANRYSASVALLIARIPLQLQKEAVKALDIGDQPPAFRWASDLLQRQFMLRLADAPFDVKQVYFRKTGADPIAPACGECPKRTGNQPELFADVRGADVCTDPACFAEKKAAHFDGVRAKAQARGQKIIDGAAAKKLAPNDHLTYMNGVRKAADHCYDDAKNRTWGQLAKQAGIEPQLLELPESKEIIQVFDESALKTALVKAGILKKALADRGQRSNEEEKRKKARAKVEVAIRNSVFEEVRGRIAATGKVTNADGAMVALELWDMAPFESKKHLVRIYGWDAAQDSEKKKLRTDVEWDAIHAAQAKIEAMDAAALWRLMIDIALVGELQVSTHSLSDKPERLNAAAERHGVDHAQIRADALADAKATVAAKKTAAKKKAGKRATATATAAETAA